MKIGLFLALLCASFAPAALSQSPTISNVTNGAIPALDVPPSTIHLVPRSLAIIFGTDLADGMFFAPPVTSLGRTEVHFAADNCFDVSCELIAKLTYVSPTQIDFIVPDNGSLGCTGCVPTGYRIIFVRNGQRIDNRNYAAGGPGRVFIDSSLTSDADLVFQVGYDCLYSFSLSDPTACGYSQFQAGQHRVPVGAVTDSVTGALITPRNPVHQGQLITLWMTGLIGSFATNPGTGLNQQTNPAPIGFGVAQFGQDLANTLGAGPNGPVGTFLTAAPVWAGEPAGSAGFDQVNVAFPTCANVPVAVTEKRYDAFLTYTSSQTGTTVRLYLPFVIAVGEPDCHWLISSSTTLSSNINPASPGQSVTFTATVSPSDATGSVTFFDGGTTLATVDLQPGAPVSGGSFSSIAAFSTSSLAPGPHTILAVYNGNLTFQGSTAALGQIVRTSTTTAISSSANPSSFSHLTFTVTVFPQAATGTVTLFDGVQNLGSVNLTNGRALFDGSGVAVGTHSILARYSGDTNNAPSSATISQTVVPNIPTITLSSNPNPAALGQVVTLTASVCCNVTGTVTFFADGLPLGTASVGPPLPISGGSTSNTATFTTSSLTQATHAITARYNGDTNNDAVSSNSLAETVGGLLPSTMTLSSNLNPAAYGRSVVFTAVVSPSDATGTVTFYDGINVMGILALQPSAPISGGTTSSRAAFLSPTLSVGTHAITARYSGDAHYGNSVAEISQTVYLP